MLNAFRHHGGRHTRRCGDCLPDLVCAQRLSASRRASPRLRPGRPAGGDVLNAFRHHGGRHWRMAKHEWHQSTCSTPFGITEGVTGRPQSLDRRREFVLNAFRHHGGRHPPSLQACRSRCLVLNAFRQHGGRHGHVLGLLRFNPSVCSTPFGITEGVTSEDRVAGFGSAVLNAFRHHGGPHINNCISP